MDPGIDTTNSMYSLMVLVEPLWFYGHLLRGHSKIIKAKYENVSLRTDKGRTDTLERCRSPREEVDAACRG